MLLPNKIIGGSCNIRYISSVGFVPGHNWLDRHWFLKRGTQYKCLSLEPFSGEFSWFWWGSINKYRCGITRLFANTLQGQKKYCFWRWWENGAAIWAESEGRSVVFVTRRQSMQQGDWNAFGDGNRWPFHFPWPVSLATINCWLLPPGCLMESPCMSYECGCLLSNTCTCAPK